MSIHTENDVVQSLLSQLLQQDSNKGLIVKTLLNATYHSWKIQAPEVVIVKPLKNTLYINAGVCWNIKETYSTTTEQMLNEDIALFAVQELSFWMKETLNLQSIEEFSDNFVAEQIGSFILSFVEKQNFFQNLSFDYEKNTLIETDYYVTQAPEYFSVQETTVSFPIFMPSLIEHLVNEGILQQETLDLYHIESELFYSPELSKIIRIEGEEGITGNAKDLINKYFSDSYKDSAIALKISKPSQEQANNLENIQKIKHISEINANTYIFSNISSIIVNEREETVFNIDEIKMMSWKELTKSIDLIFCSTVPYYERSKWDNVIEKLIPYEKFKDLVFSGDNVELSLIQEPTKIYKDLLAETGVGDNFDMKVSFILIDMDKIFELMK